MYNKLIVIFAALMISSVFLYSQSLEGTYMVGDQKARIIMDDYEYFVIHEDSNDRGKLIYEENTPENDQIWIEKQYGKRVGTFVLKSDYSEGMFTGYFDNRQYFVRKIE
jgi:hypothetical protein